MGNDRVNNSNGKERRKGEDRRTGERRDSNRERQGGVLTTRAGERRRQTRRTADRKKKS
ncbi:MAG TPA: hypothetical protein VF131_16080 [Blastocatellia bacterium]|nr:hypothetical protein [Blastocatellia bacterium]